MKNAVTLFSELGERLGSFGEDAASRAVVEAAHAANGWFLPDEIVRSVRTLADGMLRRDRLEAWVAAYPWLQQPHASRNVLVVMAGNIPLVGFFDLLCVLVGGHRCLVKPSAKDRVLMEYVVEQLRAIDPSVAVAFYEEGMAVDAVIATGSDNANRYFRSHYAGILSLLRGSRQSVAVLSGSETPEQWAALSDDIWAYSGLGCRNVSLLFLPKGVEPTLEMPRVNGKYRNNYIQQKALLEMQGTPFVDLGAAVLVEQRAFPNALSRIACTHYDSLEEVAAWLADHDDELQCVVTECLPHSRRAAFGQAQSPSLTDYPDDRDVIAWLATLNG
ncbi:MAG TPA: aldehyde dehydrogenase [Candidatus Alistipes intestinigallinarum]|uniref:Aldehyde dehydrogenase n=1 Tax=Candidatus Alistipes intestinigallinarum TaxID=2838440 RepID=A0A9D1YZX1_9BACT|nr:aldehyde dehydrogenase [Candidatus Alistipes intestinigallinarum]